MMRTKTNVGDKGGRYVFIDALRGFAVLLMIIYHVVFDLNGFRLINIELTKNPFWYALPRFIVSLFLICVGMGLALAHKQGILWPQFRRRLYVIGAWALVISLVTYALFPRNFVFFGILHCIFFASLAGIFFVNRPKLSLALCLVLVISALIFRPSLIPMAEWLRVKPFDYIPFYPWFGMVLFGIFLESIGFHRIPLRITPWTRVLKTMGQHSLKIYLIHRPILFGGAFLLYKL
jgi:uncharacterized membrane protein